MPYMNTETKREYDRKRYSKMKESYKNRASRFYSENKEKVLCRKKKHYYDNREIMTERSRKYNVDNREKIKERKSRYYFNVTRIRLIQEPALRIKWRLRKRIWSAIKLQGGHKHQPTLELLGCKDIDIVRKHLESKFQTGMCWKNYGKWHIDHIKPLSKFNLLELEQQKLAFHYKNLQPLWAVDNLRKGDRTESPETTR